MIKIKVFLIIAFLLGFCIPLIVPRLSATGTESSEDNTKYIYTFNSEIFVNNTPLDMDFPFYQERRDEFKIYKLNPQAERVYLNNLKLKLRKDDLLQQDTNLWLGKKKTKNAPLESTGIFKNESISFDNLNPTAIKLWSYDLPDDRLKDFYFDMRQWIRKYEENPLSPAVYNGCAILRNEYRIFCLDLLSGKNIWSLSGEDTCEEYYETSRHPQHNSYGYELILAQDRVFTELNGKLVAIDVGDILRPKFLWKIDLGEYTLCTKPIKVDKTLVAGLINAREEIWMAGFNSENGTLEWNTYIGMSSSLSPVCTLSSIRNDSILIGTNHGVVACLSSDKGEILWIRKYTPKKYSVLDFWEQEWFKDKISDKRSVKYDTQFMLLDGAGPLYYKPRESEYLYVVDPETGKLAEEIWIDPKEFYIVGVFQGKRILLSKDGKSIKILNAESGPSTYTLSNQSGELKGVAYLNNNEFLLKVAETIYFFKVGKDKIDFKKLSTGLDGWLLNGEGRFIFVGNGNTLSCLDILNKKYPYLIKDSGIDTCLRLREKTMEDFNKVSTLSPASAEYEEIKNRLPLEIEASNLELDKIFSLIASNPQKLSGPVWKDFNLLLKNKYGNEIVKYKGVQTRFTNFLYGLGLVDAPFKIETKNSTIETLDSKSIKNYEVRSDNMVLVPLNIIEAPRLLDFFLVLNKDQLICVRENGDILWIRRICCGKHFSNKATPYYDHVESIQAYLYNDIIIINDFTNIVAVNAGDGAYLWGMTDLDSKNLHVGFAEDRFVAINDTKIYSINPANGICDWCGESEAIKIKEKEVYFVEGLIYVLPADLSGMWVLNKETEILKKFPLDFIDNKGSGQKECVFSAKYIILHDGLELYYIDKNTGKLENKFSIKDDVGKPIRIGAIENTAWESYSPEKEYWYNIHPYKNSLLVIAPFRLITAYSLDDASGVPKWKMRMRTKGQIRLCKLSGTSLDDLHSYFIVDGFVMLFEHESNKNFMDLVDIESGKILWSTLLRNTDGHFCRLSGVRETKGVIDLVVSTAQVGNTIDLSPIFVDVDSKLFKINLQDGSIIRSESLPSVSDTRFKEPSFIETSNWVLYGIHRNKIKAARKDGV